MIWVPGKTINVAPVEIPKWFDDIAAGNRWGKFYRAPHGIIWLMSHKEVLPYKSYRALEEADLLQIDEKGRTIFYRYGHQEVSPYGPLKERIM